MKVTELDPPEPGVIEPFKKNFFLHYQKKKASPQKPSKYNDSIHKKTLFRDPFFFSKKN